MIVGTISSFADAPFIPFAGITVDGVSRLASTLDICSGQRLRLFAIDIGGRQGFETADYAFLQLHRNGDLFPSFACGKRFPRGRWMLQ